MNYSDWIEELENEDRVHKPYRMKAEKVEKRYRLEEASRFNVLWSNVEIQHSSLYSQTPKPDVQRRYKEPNDAARDAAEILQRALEFSIDQYDFDGVINPCINNYLVSALGQAKVVYDARFRDADPERVPVLTLSGDDGDEYYEGDQKLDAEDVSTDEQGAFLMRSPGEVIAYQSVWCRVVPWKRFRWSPAKDYEGVWWQGEDLYMTEDQVRDTYVLSSGDIIPLGFSHDEGKNKDRKGKLAKVVEIWDRRNRKRFGLIEGLDKLLQYRAGEEAAPDDPYGLQNFWPYPKPLFANATAGDWVPVPDFLYYQDQAIELDRITKRIDALTEQLKWRGVRDGAFDKLAELAGASDGQFISIENYGERFGQKGLESVFAEMPLRGTVDTLKFLHEAREQVKQTIFEITGLSDIVRGATDPNETLGAQQLKGQFANLRVSKRQQLVQRFVRDIMRIKAEIIAEHFEAEQLSMMTGIMVTPEIQSIMRTDALRDFSVDIETDSTIVADQSQEQQNRVEVVRAVTELVTAWSPIVAQLPPAIEIVKETVLFLLGGFKAGSALEDTFEKLSDGTTPGVDALAGGAVGVPGASPGNNLSVVQRQ